jgi:hypothetical protein
MLNILKVTLSIFTFTPWLTSLGLSVLHVSDLDLTRCRPDKNKELGLQILQEKTERGGESENGIKRL